MVKNEGCPKVNANQKLELMRTFTITIGWLCELSYGSWRAYVSGN